LKTGEKRRIVKGMSEVSPVMQTECSAAWLARAGLRPTRQRRALADLLLGGGHRHLTAEALHGEALEADAGVSLATVYNTLKAFTSVGLLREIVIEPGRVYYDTRSDDHPHFYHEDDGTIADAPVGSVAFASLPDAPEGMEIASVDVVVRLRKSQ